jgi:hypothetical protein
MESRPPPHRRLPPLRIIPPPFCFAFTHHLTRSAHFAFFTSHFSLCIPTSRDMTSTLYNESGDEPPSCAKRFGVRVRSTALAGSLRSGGHCAHHASQLRAHHASHRCFDDARTWKDDEHSQQHAPPKAVLRTALQSAPRKVVSSNANSSPSASARSRDARQVRAARPSNPPCLCVSVLNPTN